MTDRLERLLAGAVIALSVWIGANWLLAMTQTLTRRNVLIVAVLFVVGALAFLRKASWTSAEVSGWTVGAAALITLWMAFILWRSWVVPPLSYDAMTYHLPKAALLVQNHGYTHFASPDPRLRTFPANYELLVADVFLLTGSDAVTEWIGALFYLLLLGGTALLARRWWGPGLHVVACVLAAAGAPMLLLHSGADKNDLMAGFFAVMAIYWSARWCSERGAWPAVLAILCGALAGGTKLTAASVLFGVAPFGLIALVRRPPRAKFIVATIVFAAIALLFLGGWVFVMNRTAPPSPIPIDTVAGVPTTQYAHWSQLWTLPLNIVRVSLGFGAPFRWPKHDLFFSHFGMLFGIAVLALPFCVWRYRSNGERTIGSVAALIAFATLLPLAHEAPNLSAAILRYGLFILPFVLAWTVAPVVRELASRRAGLANVMMVILAATFAFQATDIAANDTFAPIEYVRWAAAHPGTREGIHVRVRAAAIADPYAGPNDTIAITGGTDVWIYPAYGRGFTRKVLHLPYATRVADVPDDVQWLLIDYPPSPGRPPTEAQLRFFREAERDPRFVLRFRHRGRNQAIFQRVAK